MKLLQKPYLDPGRFRDRFGEKLRNIFYFENSISIESSNFQLIIVKALDFLIKVPESCDPASILSARARWLTACATRAR